jgi:cell division protein FtsA
MSKSKLISAIDVGSSKITSLIAQHREDEPGKLHIIGASSVPSRGVRKGQIVTIDEAVSAIEESVEAAERMAGYNISQAWVSVGGSHINSQNSHGVVAVAQPQGEIVPEDVRRVLEAAKAVSLPSASEIIHIIPRSYSVDSQDGIKNPLGMTGVRLEVDTHIITGLSPVIKNLTKCINEVGCDISGLIFSGLASAEAVLTETDKELGVVLVDIGGGTMSLAIYLEGALAHSSVMQVGAINVTKDIAAGLRVSLESAEKIKLHLSTVKSKEDDLDLSSLKLPEELKAVSYKTLHEGIIRYRLNEMFGMVAGAIKESGFGGLTPSGVVLCGGGSLTLGVIESAKRILSMPVKIGSPIGISGLVDDIDNPAFASSVGLLRYAQKQAEDESNGRSSFISSLPSFDKLPSKGIVNKAVQWIKSLLP